MRLSDLIGKEVVDEVGWQLGRVFDVRAEAREGGDLTVTGLVLGRRALAERLFGERIVDGQVLSPQPVIPWDDVLRVDPQTIVVKAGARPEPRGEG